MTQNPVDPPINDPYRTPSSTSGATTAYPYEESSTSSKTDEAREQGRQVADSAKGEARKVTETAKDQASRVADEAKHQGRNLLSEARGQAKSQAQGQTDRAASFVRDLAGNLQALSEGRTEEAGAIGSYAQQATQQAQQFADRIEQRGFDGIVEDVQSFARRKPGLFLFGAAVAGFATGRLLRGARDASSSNGGQQQYSARTSMSSSYTTGTDEWTGPEGRVVDVTTPQVSTPASQGMATSGYLTEEPAGESSYTDTRQNRTEDY